LRRRNNFQQQNNCDTKKEKMKKKEKEKEKKKEKQKQKQTKTVVKTKRDICTERTLTNNLLENSSKILVEKSLKM